MKMLIGFFVALSVIGTFLAHEAYSSEEVPNRHNVTVVKLKIGTITEVEFPGTIANVTKSIPSESLQVETLGTRMFLLAREMLDSYLYVVTQDNVSYCLHLLIDDAEAVARVHIKKPESAEGGQPKNKNEANTIELMKSLISGRPLPGVVSSREDGKEVFNNGTIRIVVDEVYELEAGTKAFVLSLENLTNRPIVMPIEHIELPGLLAISTDKQILEARPHDRGKDKACTAKAYMIIEGVK
jgi:hypothetical protein